MWESIRVIKIMLLCPLLLLGACSGTTSDIAATEDTEEGSLAMQTISGSVKGALEAVQSPLVDLNIKRSEIPESLQHITGRPYATPERLQCKVMKEEIEALDSALGPDMSSGEIKNSLTDDKTDYVKEGASMLQSEAIGFVAGKASIIPFRGIVRQVTGAAKHSKEVARAYESGKLRRAYLKGLSTALKCDQPTKQKLASKKTLVVSSAH